MQGVFIMAEASGHAKNRIRDRCGIPKRAVNRLVEKAFDEGITHSETNGALNNYISSLYFYNMTANNIKIFNAKVFIFSNDVLITVLNLPREFKKAADKIKRKRIQ